MSKPMLAAKIDQSILCRDPSESPIPLRRQRRRQGAGIVAFAIDAKTGNLTLLNSQPSGGAGPVPSRRRSDGQERPRRQLQRRQLHLHSDQGRRHARRARLLHSAQGQEHQPRQPARPARSFDQSRQGQQVRLLLRSRPRQDHHLPLRRRQGNADAARPAGVRSRPRHRPSPFRLPSRRQERLHQWRNRHDAHRLRLRCRKRRPDARSRCSRRCRRTRCARRGSTAEIVVHPSGNFVYVSNRDPYNSIAIFSIDPKTGELKAVGHRGTRHQDAAQLRHRADGQVHAGRQSIGQQRDLVPHQSDDRRTDADRQQRRSRQRRCACGSCRWRSDGMSNEFQAKRGWALRRLRSQR